MAQYDDISSYQKADNNVTAFLDIPIASLIPQQPTSESDTWQKLSKPMPTPQCEKSLHLKELEKILQK